MSQNKGGVELAKPTHLSHTFLPRAFFGVPLSNYFYTKKINNSRGPLVSSAARERSSQTAGTHAAATKRQQEHEEQQDRTRSPGPIL